MGHKNYKWNISEENGRKIVYDIIDKITKKGEKNLLLSIIDSDNRRRYLGVKLK